MRVKALLRRWTSRMFWPRSASRPQQSAPVLSALLLLHHRLAGQKHSCCSRNPEHGVEVIQSSQNFERSLCRASRQDQGRPFLYMYTLLLMQMHVLRLKENRTYVRKPYRNSHIFIQYRFRPLLQDNVPREKLQSWAEELKAFPSKLATISAFLHSLKMLAYIH